MLLFLKVSCECLFGIRGFKFKFEIKEKSNKRQALILCCGQVQFHLTYTAGPTFSHAKL